MDGDAGVDTIRELIRRLYFNKAIYGRSEIIGNTVTGLVQDTDGRWVYKVNDKIDTTYTGLASNEYGWVVHFKRCAGLQLQRFWTEWRQLVVLP